MEVKTATQVNVTLDALKKQKKIKETEIKNNAEIKDIYTSLVTNKSDFEK
jgi:predicted transposase YbfD/YdcC